MARERLDKALFRVARENEVDELRLRRWVSFLALCGVLQRAIDEGVITDYHPRAVRHLSCDSPIGLVLQRIWTLACPAIAVVTDLPRLSALSRWDLMNSHSARRFHAT
jgi:hypothetical protein